MPHPHVLPRPRVGALAARMLLAAAIIAGLLGMHVLMSPGAHGAHTASATMMAASSPQASHHDAMDAHDGTPAQAEPCAPSSCADALLPSSDAGAWAVMCVLALLLTALIAARPLAYWRAPRRALVRADCGRLVAERDPRHPPSLIALSISRT